MAGGSFSFFALADFGIDIHYFIPSMSRDFLQSALAMKLVAKSPKVDIRFMALLGDNAYPMGVSGTEVVWRGIFESVAIERWKRFWHSATLLRCRQPCLILFLDKVRRCTAFAPAQPNSDQLGKPWPVKGLTFAFELVSRGDTFLRVGCCCGVTDFTALPCV